MSNSTTPAAGTDESSTRDGLYDLPVIGRPLSEVRDFYDEMEPTPDDSFGVACGKNVIRYGTVGVVTVAAAGTAMVVCL